jgi:hypothetical protein
MTAGKALPHPNPSPPPKAEDVLVSKAMLSGDAIGSFTFVSAVSAFTVKSYWM